MTAEYEGDFAADQDFAVQDSRKGREGQDRSDKAVPSRFYLAISEHVVRNGLIGGFFHFSERENNPRAEIRVKPVWSQLISAASLGPMRKLRCALARRRSPVPVVGTGNEAGASLPEYADLAGTEIEAAVGTVSLVHTESEKRNAACKRR